MTVEPKLAAQQKEFPAHFQEQEEGLRQVTVQANQEGTADEVEELPLRGNKDRALRVNHQLPKDFKEKLSKLFQEYEDVFAWDHTELKGIDPKVCQHRILLKPDARHIRMQRYRMNPNYAKRVKEELDALLKVGFIADVESSDWLFPIVVVRNKNG